MSLTNGAPDAVRYAWVDVPASQLLYDATRSPAAGGLTGLPAGPFWANCSAAACALITPGQLPEAMPQPHPPPHNPPAPPAPPSEQCAFSNHTSITGAKTVGQLEVPFL